MPRERKKSGVLASPTLAPALECLIASNYRSCLSSQVTGDRDGSTADHQVRDVANLCLTTPWSTWRASAACSKP